LKVARDRQGYCRDCIRRIKAQAKSEERRMTGAKGGSSLLKFVPIRIRPQPSDFTAVATWGVAAGTVALWMIQPFDWIKEQFTAKPEDDQQT